MRKLAVALCASTCLTAAFAEHVLREYPWDRVMANGAPKGAQVVADAPGRAHDRLKVENPSGQPFALPVLTIENPPITRARYAVTGFVRHEGVEGKAYLEMWCHFPGKAPCFTRTLAEGGPMRHLEGASGWRVFTLPFYSEEGAPPPEKLVVNVVLPGRGLVYLSRLRLAEYRPDEDPLEAVVQGVGWWGERVGGLIGGALGALIGCLGGTIGLLAGKGKARRFVLASLKVATALGVALAALGVVALATDQPYQVYYPLLLAGGLSAVIPAALLPKVRKRYDGARS